MSFLFSFDPHTISPVLPMVLGQVKFSLFMFLLKSIALSGNPNPLVGACERRSERLISFSLQRNSSTDREERVSGSGDRQRAVTHLENTAQQAVLSRSQFSDVDFYLIKSSRGGTAVLQCGKVAFHITSGTYSLATPSIV